MHHRLRLLPFRQTPFQRTPRQTRLDEYRTETHPLRLGRRHLLQEVQPDDRYTYIYDADPDRYEPLAQVRNHTNAEGESKQENNYFHCDQAGIPREMTDKDGNLVWFGNYTGWGRLKEETRVTDSAYQPFRLQNQYADRETGLHYNFFRYYEPDAGRFVNQDPIGLDGGDNLYWFALNMQEWVDPLGLATRPNNGKYHIFFGHKLDSGIRYSSDAVQFNDANKAFIKKMESNLSFKRDMLNRYPELKEWMKSGDMSSSPNWGKGKNKQGLT